MPASAIYYYGCSNTLMTAARSPSVFILESVLYELVNSSCLWSQTPSAGVCPHGSFIPPEKESLSTRLQQKWQQAFHGLHCPSAKCFSVLFWPENFHTSKWLNIWVNICYPSFPCCCWRIMFWFWVAGTANILQTFIWLCFSLIFSIKKKKKGPYLEQTCPLVVECFNLSQYPFLNAHALPLSGQLHSPPPPTNSLLVQQQ